MTALRAVFPDANCGTCRKSAELALLLASWQVAQKCGTCGAELAELQI